MKFYILTYDINMYIPQSTENLKIKALVIHKLLLNIKPYLTLFKM